MARPIGVPEMSKTSDMIDRKVLFASVGHVRFALLLAGAIGIDLAVASPAPAAETPTPSPTGAAAAEIFLGKVGPLLKERCLSCHGDDPKKLRGGLDLRTREAMLRGGESGEPSVAPGQPEESPLYLAVTRSDPTLAMPPKDNDKLSPDDVAAIAAWIAGGAPWPSAGAKKAAGAVPWEDPAKAKAGVPVATSGGLSPEWTNRRYKPEDLWCYQPVRRPAIPAVVGSLPNASPIDAFLAAKQTALGVTPAPSADRPTLIRRATFDLTGLPPTPEEIAAFVADPDGDERAFSRVVDRLLASPHYGEQWGRHWLDVTRYADSSGFANDYERGNAWRYRDYVVRSFNDDTPYDRFVREQIAGDEMKPENPEALIAAGFLRMGPWELTGMEVAKVARQKYLDDVTDSVGQVFLAHPLQCCRCHDHKFDPIPTRDYYSFQAVFATTQLAERPAPFLPVENIAGFEEQRYLKARRAALEAILEEIRAKEDAAARKWCSDRGLPYVPRVKGLREGTDESKLPPARVGLEVRDFGLQRIGNKGLERLRWELERYEPIALSVYAGRTPELRAVTAPPRMPRDRATAGELEATCILVGGDPFSPKDPVTPGVLSAVASQASSPWQGQEQANGDGPSEAPAVIPTTIEGRRTALADWIASPANPLTPRVMVNRLWLWHFGRAIAGSPNNFGATGKKPTHPELLDWLASEFVARGWSVKAMQRLMMNSEAYRRSSRHPDPASVAAHDPEGIGYAVFRPRRLEAEELRDALLAVTGELSRAVGGIPIRPELNPEVALQPRMVMGTFASAWQPSTRPEQRHRRSLYALKLRGLRDPFFEVFNQPSPETSCESRDASTVTPQVFSLFNSTATRDRALALAVRLERESHSHAEAIHRAFHLALGRVPTEAEAKACLAHWDAMSARHRSLRLVKSRPPDAVVREAVEENNGEKFTFTEVLESAADFVPDLQPADVGPETRGLMEVCLVLLNTNEFVSID
jgi:mono/diheme cytochrome c family protein